MQDSSMSLPQKDAYMTMIDNLISQYKNNILHKCFNSYLSENYREAESILLSQFPENSFNKDPMVQYLMGLLKYKLEEYKSALNYFDNVLNLEINLKAIVYDNQGYGYLMQKNYYLAEKNFKAACTSSQNNFHFHNHLAIFYKIIYSIEKETHKKIELEDSKSQNSKNFGGKYSSSKSDNSSDIESSDYEKEKLQKKIGKEINEASKTNTNGTKIRNKYKSSFQEALNINPNSYISLLNLGTFFVEEGEIGQAEKYYKRAEMINKQTTGKKDWKIYINLAYLAFKEKEYPLSMGYFEILFKSFENKVDLKALNVYMICLYQNKEWKKLEKITKKILKIDKKNKKALFYLILSLEKNKKNEDLLHILEKVKEKMKTIKSDYIKESSRQSRSKSEKDLEEQFQYQTPLFKYKKLKEIIIKKLKKVKEDIRIEKQNLIKYQNGDSNLDDLCSDNLHSFGFKHDFIEKILTLQNKNKNNLEVLFNLGYIYYKEEEFLKSEEYFKKLIAINPEYKKYIINEYLGDIYMYQYNSPKKALGYYSKAHFVPFNNSMNGDNISSSNANNLSSTSGKELLLVKIGLCHEVLEDNESALRYYKLAQKKNEDFVNPIFHIGCIYDKMNKTEEALEMLEIAYEKEKENVDYLQKYGDCLVKSDDEKKISKGILILEKGIEFFTGNIEIISSLAKGYEKQGRLKEAISILEKAQNNEEFFNNKSKIFQLAFYYEKNKELTKALEYFKKVLFLDKKNIDALLHIGFIYHSLKENSKAFKCFKQVLKFDKNNFLGYYGLARLYQSLEKHNIEAINCFKKCLELEPDNIKANLQLGILFLKIKNYDESLIYLEKVVNLEPNNILGLVALGNVHLEIKNYNEAEKYLESALDIDKKNVAANAALGDVLFAKNEINGAIQKYVYVNKLNDNIPEIHLNLGHCFFYNERFDSAISHYLKAIKLVKNTRHDYYYFLGNALIASFRVKDGIIAYQAAIKLKPSKLNYYYAIAKACYIQKLNHKGIKYLEKLLHLEKDKNINKDLLEAEKDYKFNDALFLLYKLYVTLPDPDYNKCLVIVKALIRNDPKNVHYFEILAGLQEKKSNFLEAIKAYRQILALEPNNSEAKKKLNLLDINEKERNEEQKQSSCSITDLSKNILSRKSKKSSKNKKSSNKSESESSSNNKSSSNSSESSKQKEKSECKSSSQIESNSNSKSKSESKSNNKSSNIKENESKNKSNSKSKSSNKNESKSKTKKSENKIKSFNLSNKSKQSESNKSNEDSNKKSNKSSEEEDEKK